MFNVKRAAVLAVSAGLAAVPIFGLQAAGASTGPAPAQHVGAAVGHLAHGGMGPAHLQDLDTEI